MSALGRVDELGILKAVEGIVRKRLAGQQAGHGVDHIRRVVNAARHIQAQAGGDAFVVELAAWLHDLGDAKFHAGVERSGEFAREILSSLEVEPAIIDHVVHIVDNISFRKRDHAAALTLEGQIVQDADRLDALGAVGIVRTIEYGAACGQPFYIVDDPTNPHTGVGHFHEKLFKLRDLLNTEPARQLADQREQFMRDFLQQFINEQSF